MNQVQELLSLGFVPSPDGASAYVERLFGCEAGDIVRPADMLCRIVEEAVGNKDIVVPLTGGFDSRGLLGAALQVADKNRIQCITFGRPASRDIRIPRQVCEIVGVKHAVVDPDTMLWDIPSIMGQMTDRWRRFGTLPPIDGLVAFEALAAAIPPDAVVLSGFLGDAASGAHLPTSDRERDDDRGAVVAAFLRHNACVLRATETEMFSAFLHKHITLRSRWQGLTAFDLLDFGFRQNLRIKCVTTGAFKNVVTPYEDPRWLWLSFSQPVSQRVGQRRYRAMHREAFPKIFPESRKLSPAGRLKRLVRRSIQSLQPRPPVPWASDRGDIRKNASMRAVLSELALAFDARRTSPISAGAALSRLETKATVDDFDKVRWAATAEIAARLLANQTSSVRVA